jgi:hypothetical protein
LIGRLPRGWYALMGVCPLAFLHATYDVSLQVVRAYAKQAAQ